MPARNAACPHHCAKCCGLSPEFCPMRAVPATQLCSLTAVWRIRFATGVLLREAASTGHGGDLGPSAGLPRLHGVKSNASRGAPTFSPSLPCPAVERSSLLGGAVKRSFYYTAFPNPASGNQIRHTVTSGCAPRYARYIADAAINGFVFGYIIHVINELHI